MELQDVRCWLSLGAIRRQILEAITQPLTAKQISKRTKVREKYVCRALHELRVYELVQCLNPIAHKSRVYWLTSTGLQMRGELGYKPTQEEIQQLPEVDWSLYGTVCFTHRSAVLKAMDGMMQPSQIKRRARFQNPELKMSANNARDIVMEFEKAGIVNRVHVRGAAHARFELTRIGKMMQELLFKAEDVTCLS